MSPDPEREGVGKISNRDDVTAFQPAEQGNTSMRALRAAFSLQRGI